MDALAAALYDDRALDPQNGRFNSYWMSKIAAVKKRFFRSKKYPMRRCCAPPEDRWDQRDLSAGFILPIAADR
jgi:hypothetical protein